MRLLLDNGITDVVEFGRYWEETGMKNTPIQWLVLEETDEYLFLTTKKNLQTVNFLLEFQVLIFHLQLF